MVRKAGEKTSLFDRELKRLEWSMKHRSLRKEHGGAESSL